MGDSSANLSISIIYQTCNLSATDQFEQKEEKLRLEKSKSIFEKVMNFPSPEAVAAAQALGIKHFEKVYFRKHGMRDLDLALFAKHCRNIKCIELNRMFLASRKTVEVIAKHYPSLYMLNLFRVDRNDRHLLTPLIEHKTQLKHINISELHLDLKQVLEFLNTCKELEFINFGQNISLDFIDVLAKSQVSAIAISTLPSFHIKECCILLKQLPQIKYLTLFSEGNILSEEDLEMIKDCFKGLQSLKISLSDQLEEHLKAKWEEVKVNLIASGVRI